MRIPNFWKALELCPRTLKETWQSQVESELGEVIRFFKVSDQLASHYPDPERPRDAGPWPEYRVVSPGPNQYVGIHPEGFRIPLTTEQIQIYEPDWTRIRQNLCVALGVAPEIESVAGCRRTHRLGTHRQLSGTSLPIYLMACFSQAQFDQEAMAFLLQVNQPCVLLTPGETWLTPAIQDRLHGKQIATVALQDQVQVTPRGFQLVQPLAELLIHTIVATPPTPSLFRRRGPKWELAYAGLTVDSPHLKGLTLIAYLLRHPNRELSAWEVEQASVGGPAIVPGSAGAELDEFAISSYRQQVQELREELAEAERHHDLGRQELLQSELALLEQQLTKALGLGGRRRQANDDGERCRKRVGNLITRARDHIQTVHPLLGEHLAQIRLGRTLCYRVASCPDWITSIGADSH